MKPVKDFTFNQALNVAKSHRYDTINELTYLIQDLQRDLKRLTTYHNDEDRPFDTKWFYLSQHCLRYEQVVKAGTKMEEAARIVEWLIRTTPNEESEG